MRSSSLIMEQLYEEMYAPKITPHELVSNARLENYRYVNMRHENGYLLVETCCKLPCGEEAVFTYKFDEQDHLLTLCSMIDGEVSIEYDRVAEIRKIKKQLKMLGVQHVLAV